MAEDFRSFAFIPDTETLLATTPKRYRHFKNLIVQRYLQKVKKKKKKSELQGAPCQNISTTIHSSF